MVLPFLLLNQSKHLVVSLKFCLIHHYSPFHEHVDDICVVEWPEFLEDILPQERLAMTIKRIDDDRREFILKPIGKKYEELVKEIEYENNCHG